MNCVSFLVSFCDVLGVIFSLFSDLGLASVVKGGPGLTKMQKERKTLQKGVPKRSHFSQEICIFYNCFSIDFWNSLGKCFLAYWWPKCPK